MFGESPSKGRKRRGVEKSRSKKRAPTSPVGSIDFVDYFEEIGLRAEEQWPRYDLLLVKQRRTSGPIGGWVAYKYPEA